MKGRLRGVSKYGAKKIVTDEGTFDSKKEFERWQQLKLLVVGGCVRRLRRQVPYELLPEQREPSWTGKRGAIHKGKVIERSCTYIADFVYEEKRGDDWVHVVEDCKGMRTADYIIKRKLMLYMYNVRIKET